MNNPTIVSVSGASGSGKTNITNGIISVLGKSNAIRIDLDGYHKHDRDERKVLNEYPEQLEANDFIRMKSDILKLKNNLEAAIPQYDHYRGKFMNELYRVQPKPYIILDGLHAGYLKAEKNLVDLSLFVYTDENYRRAWKANRDVTERNYDFSRTSDEIRYRSRYDKQYIYPQMDLADFIINISRGESQYHSHPQSTIYISRKFYNNFFEYCFCNKVYVLEHINVHSILKNNTLYKTHLPVEIKDSRMLIKQINKMECNGIVLTDSNKICLYGNAEFNIQIKVMSAIIYLYSLAGGSK